MSNSIKRICLFGPESTGKSTLAKDLANHYNTAFVDEYAKRYIVNKNDDLVFSDLNIILEQQIKNEELAAVQAKGLLFCDSDALTTKIWSEYLFKKTSSYVDRMTQSAIKRYAHTLLLDIDVPWTNDIHRYAPDDRTSFFMNCEQALIASSRPYTVISGSWSARFDSAIKIIDKL